MKRYLSFILAIMVLAGIACLSMVTVFGGAEYAFADSGIAYTRGPDARVKIEVITASTFTPQAASSIAANDLILGYSVTGSAAGAHGLYDSASTSTVRDSGTGVFTEAYCAAGGVTTLMFPMPYTLTSGLIAVLPTTSSINVYYEDR